MAHTLIEYAKGTQDQILAGVIETFAKSSPILDALPFQDIQGGALTYNRESALPGIGFRNFNGTYTESVGVWLPATEKLKIMGGEMDTDVALVKMYGESRRAADIYAQSKAAALKFTKEFFDGDEASDVSSFDGINKRLAGDQLIYADGAGSAGANLSKNLLLQLEDAVDGKPDLFVWGKAFDRQVDALYEGSSIIGIGQDQWGRRVRLFDGIPIAIVDKDNLDATILGFDETVGSSSGTCASAYAFKFGENLYLSGIQNGGPTGQNFGEITSKPAFRYRLEWLVGIAMFHPRCAARLCGVTKKSGIV